MVELFHPGTAPRTVGVEPTGPVPGSDTAPVITAPEEVFSDEDI